MEEFEREYPQKPILVQRKRGGHISITVLSILVFAITFYFIIGDYYLIGLLLFVLLLHEGGHFLMMKLFNYEQLNMLFIPFLGAMVSGKKNRYSQVEGALMIVAGPLPGILLGSSLLLYGWLTPGYLSIQLGVMLVVLNVMNLIPVDPLDGGQLMRVLFFGKYEIVQLVFTLISVVGVVGLGLYFNSWILILFGLFLGFRIKSKHKLYLIRKEMKDKLIKYISNYEDLSDKTFAKIKSILMEHTPMLREMEEQHEETRFNQLMASQVNNVLYPPTKRDASVFFKMFMIALWLGGILLSVFAILAVDLNTIVNAFQYR